MAIREASEARRRAVRKHDAEKVDRVTIRLPKGSKEIIKKAGYSVNEYVIKAVMEQLKRDGIVGETEK
jgi:hypothetical protein